MTAPMMRGVVPVIVGGIFVQMTIAVLLIATGNVPNSIVFPRDVSEVLAAGACGMLLHAALPSKSSPPLRAPGRGAFVQLGLLLASVATAEEIIWRGFAFESIRLSTGPFVALVTTTAGFAAMHTFAQGWSGMRNHIITGMAFGLVFWASGSLASAIALHVSYNLMFVFGLQPQKQRVS